MGNRFAALSFGISFKEFANLEEEHHEHGFGELGFCTREESDAERTQCGDGHEEVLVERFALHDPFDGFLDGVETNHKVGDKIDEQQLPRGQSVVVFDIYSDEEQNDGESNLDQRLLQSTFFMMVVMFVFVMLVRMTATLASLFVFIVMMVMMFVCHILVCFIGFLIF